MEIHRNLHGPRGRLQIDITDHYPNQRIGSASINITEDFVTVTGSGIFGIKTDELLELINEVRNRDGN